jgi:hypothetical protein
MNIFEWLFKGSMPQSMGDLPAAQQPNFLQSLIGQNPQIQQVPQYFQQANPGMKPPAPVNPESLGVKSSPNDSLRKMMLMQFLSGGGEEQQQIPNPPSISPQMLGGGGQQMGQVSPPSIKPSISMPLMLPQRKRFIGSSGGLL